MGLYNSETNTVYWEKLLKIPEFKVLSETPQNALWHKEGNAYIHTCMVAQCMLDYINSEKDPLTEDLCYRDILVYSALLHDIGKGITTVKGEDGLYHCPNHAIKGVTIAGEMILKYAPELTYLQEVAIQNLVRYHMQPLYVLNQRFPQKAILKLANNLKYIGMEALLLLKECDCKGSISEVEDHSIETLKKVRDLYYETCSYPKGTYVYIEKVKDYKYSHRGHPNGINVGYNVTGTLQHPVTIGFRTSLGFRFSTSLVVKIIDKNRFQTENSEYIIKEIKQDN